jgi:hypothetical protein
VLGGGQRSSKELGSICHSTSNPTELVNVTTSCSDGAWRCSEELGRAQTELGSICHSTSDPTELINATTNVSYCSHRFVYLIDEDRLDAYYNGEPLRYRTIANIFGNHSPPSPSQCLFAELHLTHASKPANFIEAKDDPAWRAAME